MLHTARTRSDNRRERRPYAAFLTAQLEQVARERWDDAAVLRMLGAELRHRTRLRAVRLAAHVEERLRELDSRVEPGASSGPTRAAELQRASPPAVRVSDAADGSVGVLAASGYRVGKNGAGTEARCQALRHVVEHEITDVDDRAYLASWGRPGSVERLRRTAHVLAKLARGARTRGPSMTSARVAWSRDLTYLKERYCDGRHENAFPWPSDRS